MHATGEVSYMFASHYGLFAEAPKDHQEWWFFDTQNRLFGRLLCCDLRAILVGSLDALSACSNLLAIYTLCLKVDVLLTLCCNVTFTS